MYHNLDTQYKLLNQKATKYYLHLQKGLIRSVIFSSD